MFPIIGGRQEAVVFETSCNMVLRLLLRHTAFSSFGDLKNNVSIIN